MRPAIVEQSSLTPLGIVVSRGPFPMGLQFPVMSQSNPGADQPTDLQAVTGLWKFEIPWGRLWEVEKNFDTTASNIQ